MRVIQPSTPDQPVPHPPRSPFPPAANASCCSSATAGCHQAPQPLKLLLESAGHDLGQEHQRWPTPLCQRSMCTMVLHMLSCDWSADGRQSLQCYCSLQPVAVYYCTQFSCWCCWTLDSPLMACFCPYWHWAGSRIVGDLTASDRHLRPTA